MNIPTRTVTLISKAFAQPLTAVRTLFALMKGKFYKTWYPIIGIRFVAGKNLRIFGQLRIEGPGQVTFGDDVVVDMRVTPFTYDIDAKITIGNHCFLNGTRFGCRSSIVVGDNCILAESRIMDTNFHSLSIDRWNPKAPVVVREIIIEDNVWVAAEAGLLPGTKVGRNSVIGFGAVCSSTYPPNSLVVGNPARQVRMLE